VKIMRDGRPAELSDFREGDKLSATIVTSRPPHIMTEKEVQATVPTAAAAAATSGGGSSAPARTPTASSAPSSSTAANSGSAAPGGSGRTLPKTASSWPLLALASVLSLVVGLALMVRRVVG